MRWLALLVALVGCKKEAKLPAEIPYQIEVAFLDKNSGQYVREHPARGASVFEDGKLLAQVDSSDSNRDLIKFKRTSQQLPSKFGKLEVEIPTPCGPKRIPLDLMTAPKEQNEKKWMSATLSLGDGTAQMTARAPAAEVSLGQRIRIEWGTGNESLSIGSLVVKPPTSTVLLYDLECKPDIPLTMGTTAFGKLAFGSEGFILAEAGTCYSVQSVGYGTSSGAPQIIKAPYYSAGTIAFFLTPPTESIQVASVQKEAVRTSVQPAACPPADAPK